MLINFLYHVLSTGAVLLLAAGDMIIPKPVERLTALHFSDDLFNVTIGEDANKDLGELSILDNGSGHVLPRVVTTPVPREEAQDVPLLNLGEP